MDLAAWSAVTGGPYQRVPPKSLRASGEKHGSAPKFRQLQLPSRSGGVNQPLQRVRDRIDFRFDLASGLLSRAMNAALIAAKVQRVSWHSGLGGDEGWIFWCSSW